MSWPGAAPGDVPASSPRCRRRRTGVTMGNLVEHGPLDARRSYGRVIPDSPVGSVRKATKLDGDTRIFEARTLGGTWHRLRARTRFTRQKPPHCARRASRRWSSVVGSVSPRSRSAGCRAGKSEFGLPSENAAANLWRLLERPHGKEASVGSRPESDAPRQSPRRRVCSSRSISTTARSASCGVRQFRS